MLEREQAEALHREIDRLPGVFRVPLVLCYFEGLTLDEAAHRLRWPAGTLRSRLARARQKLRRSLTRRGFALSTTALAAARARRSARRPYHPSCAKPRPAPRSASRPERRGGPLSAPAIAAGPGGLCPPCSGTSSSSPRFRCLFLAVVATGVGWLTRPLAMSAEPVRAQATTQPPVAARPDASPRGRSEAG